MVRRLADHFQCDPQTLTENQIREYFLFLRQHKKFARTAMSHCQPHSRRPQAPLHDKIRPVAGRRFVLGAFSSPAEPIRRRIPSFVPRSFSASYRVFRHSPLPAPFNIRPNQLLPRS
jgi:hypothetical protein